MSLRTQLVIFANILFFFFVGISLGSNNTEAYAAQPKTDSCKQYQEKAKKYLEIAEKVENSWSGYYGQTADKASMSAAYASYYLVCREMERQR